jgi:hypothetical protein
MRYLVRARLRPGGERSLLQAIEHRTLGKGSVAGREYLRNMQDARLCSDGTARWVEVCYCPTPLEEERPYWEQYFELVKVQDAHDRRQCRDQNGSEPWACENCDCTERLERKLESVGDPFLKKLRGDWRLSARPPVSLGRTTHLAGRIAVRHQIVPAAPKRYFANLIKISGSTNIGMRA